MRLLLRKNESQHIVNKTKEKQKKKTHLFCSSKSVPDKTQANMLAKSMKENHVLKDWWWAKGKSWETLIWGFLDGMQNFMSFPHISGNEACVGFLINN